MSHCYFQIPFTQTPDQLIRIARTAIERHKGTLTGDSSKGEFEIPIPIGHIVGAYTIEGEVMSLTISKKPFVVTCRMIESQLRGFLSAPPVA